LKKKDGFTKKLGGKEKRYERSLRKDEWKQPPK